MIITIIRNDISDSHNKKNKDNDIFLLSMSLIPLVSPVLAVSSQSGQAAKMVRREAGFCWRSLPVETWTNHFQKMQKTQLNGNGNQQHPLGQSRPSVSVSTRPSCHTNERSFVEHVEDVSFVFFIIF